MLNSDIDPIGDRHDAQELLLLFSMLEICVLFFVLFFPNYMSTQSIPPGGPTAAEAAVALTVRAPPQAPRRAAPHIYKRMVYIYIYIYLHVKNIYICVLVT